MERVNIFATYQFRLELELELVYIVIRCSCSFTVLLMFDLRCQSTASEFAISALKELSKK